MKLSILENNLKVLNDLRIIHMTIVQTINKGVKILLFPGFMNSLYRHFGNRGNMGLAGVYMDVINKRNCVYFMGASTIFFSFFSAKYVLYFFYILTAVSLGFYFKTINSWRQFI